MKNSTELIIRIQDEHYCDERPDLITGWGEGISPSEEN